MSWRGKYPGWEQRLRGDVREVLTRTLGEHGVAVTGAFEDAVKQVVGLIVDEVEEHDSRMDRCHLDL